MQVTVFGATGKVGRLVVEELLHKGHSVVAFQRRPEPVSSHPAATIVRGDIKDAPAISRALEGSDAVISTLGSWGSPTGDVLSTAMRAIIPAMQQQGIGRIISLTGADARADGDSIGLIHQLTHKILSLLAPKVLMDGEEHIKQLQNSGLDYTVLRSPVMLSGKGEGYMLDTDRPMPWQTVRRQSVADALVDQLIDHNHITACPFIIRS